MTPIEIDEFKQKIQKETIDSIVKTIKIDDGYFSGKLIVQKTSLAEDPFKDSYSALYELRLVPLKFIEDTMVSKGMEKMFTQEPRIIKGSFTLGRKFFEKEQKEDLMMRLYDILGKEIAKDLFMRNANDINMTFQGMHSEGKRYI